MLISQAANPMASPSLTMRRVAAAFVLILAVFTSACTFDETTQRSVSGAGIGAAVGAAGGALFGAMAGVPAMGAAIGAAGGAAIGGAGGYIYDQQTKRGEAEAESERLRQENEALKAKQANP
jgi:hypothetical protein